MIHIVLIIIYNHQYNQNIDIIERLYKGRFSNIYHLVPFYQGDKKNVIPVYENSHYFQGYVAQGLKMFYKNEYEHYFFIGDDLILNPVINEKNYREQLHLNQASCFIPRLSTINESKSFWPISIEALLYNKNSSGVEAENQLPGYAEAIQLLKKHGLENGPLHFNQLWQAPVSAIEWWKKITGDKVYLARLFKNRITKKKYNLLYPLVRSYADIFVVSSETIREFSHCCGVFATTRLFVELAIPTALVFTAKEIITENDLALRGRALWTKEDHSILDKYNNKLQDLLNDFPENHLYLHPVKLSRWK